MPMLMHCDDATDTYRHEKITYMGTQIVETTAVRTGGASDGTTQISWLVSTSANPEWHFPYECLPIVIWNETVGSAITLTVEGITASAAVPTDDEVWMDVEYFGDASYPIGSTATTGKATILTTGAAGTSSSETWAAGANAFKLVKTITPQMKGPIIVTVKVAKVSTAYYIDPKITVT